MPGVADLFRRAAWKHDGWHEVVSMQLHLLDTGSPDGPPGPICSSAAGDVPTVKKPSMSYATQTDFAKVEPWARRLPAAPCSLRKT